MGIKERRLAEKEQIKHKIFDAASEIIITDGFENLSIRKIADKIEYSPGVIYNYFKDKNEIVKLIIAENIKKLCDSMLSLGLEMMEPKAALSLGLREFATVMLKNSQQYKAIMLSGMNLSSFEGDDYGTDILKQLLIDILNKGKNSGVFEIGDEAMTSLLLISAVFGLVNTIVKEKLDDTSLKTVLIDNYVDILIKGVSK